MSIQAVGWVLEHETTTSGADRLVLIALANHCGERDGVWESTRRSAHHEGRDRRGGLSAVSRACRGGTFVPTNAAPTP